MSDEPDRYEQDADYRPDRLAFTDDGAVDRWADKDAEIHRLRRDLFDAVQNIQAHSMIVDANEKDAEIERLKEENAHFAWRDADKNKLITKLSDALARADWLSDYEENQALLHRAREATR